MALPTLIDDRLKLAQEIHKAAYLTGQFKLRSGKVSDHYFDKYQFETQSQLLWSIAHHMKAFIPAGTEILAGLELGGVPLATALSLQTGIPTSLVRKKAKDYGTEKVAEGPNLKDKKVCIIEDVITTGGQVVLSTNDLREHGAIVENVLCVILREDAAIEILKKEGLHLQALYRSADLK